MANSDWVDGELELPVPQNTDPNAKNIEIRSRDGRVDIGTYYGTESNAYWTTNGTWKLNLGYQPQWRYVKEVASV
ncbi:hypothetical protein SH449x_003547 [Pirellulaceae bacterium SH449]